MTGGRFFPGVYAKADFEVITQDDRYSVQIMGKGGEKLMSISAELAEELPEGSIFESTKEVSDFFLGGNIGWSSRDDGNRYDAIELKTEEWNMEPLKVHESHSAYFSDHERFPERSVEFDSAMIMRKLSHSWVVRDEICELCC